jgi:flagellar motor switch protein FliN/FliY
MTANPTADNKRQLFSNAFFSALMEAMTEASGSPWSFSAAAEEASIQEGSEPVWVKLSLDGSLQGEFLLEIDRVAAAMLVSRIVRLSADEFGEEHSRALLKLVKDGTDRFRSAAKQEHGVFTVKASASSEPTSERANVFRVAASDQEGNAATILMYMNSILADALMPQSKGVNMAAVSGKAAKSSAKAIADQVNLNLVMDVELNVTLRFGQRQLTLREVLDLTTGSVVELDRQVEEPVELLLDGVVIARGEAVVVDGNYGLRVTEVLQPVSPTMLR